MSWNVVRTVLWAMRQGELGRVAADSMLRAHLACASASLDHHRASFERGRAEEAGDNRD